MIWVKLVEVNCVEIESVAYDEFYEEEKDEDDDSVLNLFCVLVPDENEGDWADHYDAEGNHSHPSSFYLVYGQYSENSNEQLRGLDGSSIDEDVEVELTEHERGREILQIEDDINKDEQNSH